jgi:formate/nitrite transporter FocA (FNT family)
VLAVWLAASANDIIGKIGAIWFPIMLFVLSGFEHSIANMYFIPLGIFSKGQFGAKAAELFNISSEKLATLNWGTMWTGNLIAVTLGNIVGGALIIAGIYWVTYVRESKAKQ